MELPPLDALVPWLQPRTSLGREVVDALLNGDGYYVLPNVLSDAEVRKKVNPL